MGQYAIRVVANALGIENLTDEQVAEAARRLKRMLIEGGGLEHGLSDAPNDLYVEMSVHKR